MNGLDRWGYCRSCWCELPGFPEPEDDGGYDDTHCPDCHIPDDLEVAA